MTDSLAMDIQIKGTRCTLTSYCLSNCHVTEIAFPESGETIAHGISKSSSVHSERDAMQKATQRLDRYFVRDLELMVGG